MCVAIRGDEIEVNGTSWIFLLWSSDMSPWLTNSLASRFPIGIIPKERYFHDGDLNVTVDYVAGAIARSFNTLSTHGLKITARENGQKRTAASHSFMLSCGLRLRWGAFTCSCAASVVIGKLSGKYFGWTGTTTWTRLWP